MKNKHIRYIFPTNTVRTRSTTAPIASYTGLQLESYSQLDRDFISRLIETNTNVLIVAHGNTIDDIIQQLTGINYLSTDLPGFSLR